MKHIIIAFFSTILIIILVPNYSFAADDLFLEFPQEGYSLHVASTYMEIWGPNLPGNGLIAGVVRNSMEMASRNTWLATILSAVSTGKQVLIYYAKNQTQADQYGIGTERRIGSIIAVHCPEN